MEVIYSTKFWTGFEKKANTLGHVAEVAGLGALMVPTVQSLRGKPLPEKHKDMWEAAGLGVLAAPSVAALGHKAWQSGKALLKK